ncbi:hypothetical protein THRCLA_03850 [Thraustotheca clavata]|uniref:Uncharacterized protein n=1 Tax=Thraustotheca clavata TaxID=74557 RepID=A0A1W0A0R8_9STRA|nr:hypothetical protein THRCLA_03850 [Thraustotheca clavata]
MGNGESTLASTLDGLEKTLSVLAATNPVGTRPLLPSELQMKGIVVSCSSDVRVNIGPVVGAVGANKARILIEVSVNTRLTCHLSRQEPLTGQYLEIVDGKVSVDAEKNVPVVFKFKELQPNAKYWYVFSGLCKNDAVECIGSFHTLAVEDDLPLQVAVVSGNDMHEQGQNDLWQQLAARVTQDVIDKERNVMGPVQYVLHLGGQVALSRIFEEAWVMLTMHTESIVTSCTLEEMESQVVEMFRGAYRLQWKLRFVREVLANASNLMMWSDQDIYSNFSTSAIFQINHDKPTAQMQVMRMLLRSAKRVFHEYQRQLWDEDYGAFQSEHANNGFTAAMKISKLELETTDINAKMLAIKKKMDFATTKMLETRLLAIKSEITLLEKQVQSAKENLESIRGEEFCIWTERHIAFLFLDMRGSHLSAGGSPTPDNPLLSPYQWDFLTNVLSERRTRLLIICSELPIADDTSENIESLFKAFPESSCSSWWGHRPNDQNRLLSMIADWKVELPNRDALLLSGASTIRCSMTSIVQDTQMRSQFYQYTTGPMTSKPSMQTIPALHAKLNDRFDINHTFEQPCQHNFILLQLTALQNRDPFSTITWCRQLQSNVKVLVGPIIGLVDATSCVIMLEVDRKAPVTCIVTSAFTSEEQKILKILPAKRPKVFHFTHLRSEHHYSVRFEGISQFTIMCHFHTLPLRPEKLAVALVCHDQLLYFPTPTCKPSLWTALETTLEEPFSNINLVIHLGGQICPKEHPSLDTARAIVHANDLLDDKSKTADSVKEQLRNIYRHHWNLPGIKDVLAMGGHIMIPNEKDVIETLLNQHDGINLQRGGDSDINVDEIIAAHLRDLADEYQLQLWPKSSIKKYQYCHISGTFGIFVWPKQDQIEVWQTLESFLDQPSLMTIIILCNQPLVDDSVEDLKEKAKVQTHPYVTTFPHHGQDILRLTQRLFDWKDDNEAKQIFYLCGHEFFGFDTVIQDVTTKLTSLHQFVVGPLYQLNHPAPTYLEEGSLGSQWVFKHQFDSTRAKSHFGYVEIGKISKLEIVTLDEEESTLSDYCKVVPASQWYKQGGISSIKIDTTEETSVDEDEVQFKKLLADKMDELKTSFETCVNPDMCHNSCFRVAQAIHPGLKRFYEICGLEIRSMIALPSLYLLTQVAMAEVSTPPIVVDEVLYIKIVSIALIKTMFK